MNYKKLFFSFIFLLLASTFNSTTAHALPFQIEENVLKPELMEVNPDFDLGTLKCGGRAASINNRLSKFSTRYNKHLETYTKLSDRLGNLITKWDAAGYDVDELQDDHTELDNLIDDYQASYADLTDKLDEAKDDCEDDDDYKTAMDAAKDLLKDVRQGAAAVRSHFQNVIRPHILDLKNQEI